MFSTMSLYKYNYLWSVGDKSWGSSFQEKVSNTYTLRLGYSRISILYKKYIYINKSNNIIIIIIIIIILFIIIKVKHIMYDVQ